MGAMTERVCEKCDWQGVETACVWSSKPAQAGPRCPHCIGATRTRMLDDSDDEA